MEMSNKMPAALGLAASLGLVACTSNPLGAAGASKFGIPSSVSLTLPASVTDVTSSTSSYRTQSLGVFSLAKAVQDNLQTYIGSTKVVNAILSDVASASAAGTIQAGTPFSWTDKTTGIQYTALLSTFSDHAVIDIGQGTSATGADQIIGISYTSPTQGTAVFKNLASHYDPTLGRIAFATTFDLTAGKASADAVADNTVLSPEPANAGTGRAHWEFTRMSNANPASPSFSMQAYGFTHAAVATSSNGVAALSTNFLADGSAASVAGLSTGDTASFVNASNGTSTATAGSWNAFLFLPNDDTTLSASSNNTATPHDFYMSAQGQDEPKTSANANLQAAVPPDTSIDATKFPADPGSNPFSDPRYTFPQ